MQSTAVYSFDEFQFIIIFFWNCFLCLLRNIYLISTNEDFLPFFFQEALKFLLSHDLFMLTFVYLCMYEVMVKVHDYSSECSNIPAPFVEDFPLPHWISFVANQLAVECVVLFWNSIFFPFSYISGLISIPCCLN